MAIHTYVHEHPVPDYTWTITHNLNTTAVNIDVIILNNGVYEKILPNNIETQDNNTIVITFTTPCAGNARIVGTQGV